MDELIQDRCEKRARLFTALTQLQSGKNEMGTDLLLESEDPSPVSIHNSISVLDSELLELAKTQKTLDSLLQKDIDRRSILRSVQSSEEYRLITTISAEVKGPVNGKFAIDLSTSNIPKPVQSKGDTPSGATEEDIDGRETEGLEDASEEDDTEEVEGILTLTESQIALRERRRQKDKERRRRTPEEIFRAKERAWATRYAGIVPCERCGCHVTRPELRSCDECGKSLCGRGGKSDGHPVASFCVMLHICNCGTSQCYDCLSDENGKRGGGSINWKRCAVGDVCAAPESGATDDFDVASWLCEKEQSNKTATCQACGLFPICRKCKSSHDKECGAGAVDDGFTSDSENEYDEE